jgi:hypothetical protein
LHLVVAITRQAPQLAAEQASPKKVSPRLPPQANAHPSEFNCQRFMSQSLHRPLLSVVGLSSSFERRWFSQVMRRCVPKGPAQFSRPAQPPDRSLRIAAKEMMAMPSDLGLLEGEHDRSTSNPTNMHLTDLQRHSSPHLAAIFPRSFTHLGRF